MTAMVHENGEVYFYRDIYGYDAQAAEGFGERATMSIIGIGALHLRGLPSRRVKAGNHGLPWLTAYLLARCLLLTAPVFSRCR